MQRPDGDRHAAIMLALSDVLDPELDEPVTEMGFIERVALDGDEAVIVFRLPT